ncbi:MAG: hypothetical protein Q7R39_01760 [Dehalococcoidia bacterium]|nr:hypothetical protein [Dehalococcoidia bacterium]
MSQRWLRKKCKMGISFQINVAGIAPSDVFVDPPTGPYPVRITALTREPSKDTTKQDNIKVEAMITEGEYKGVTKNIYLNLEMKAGTAKHWRALMQGVGCPAQALDSGAVTISDAQLLGKSAYLYITAANPDEKGPDGQKAWADQKFITRESYERQKTLLAQLNQGGQQAQTAPQTAPQAQFQVQSPAPQAQSQVAQPQNGQQGLAAALNFG